MLHYFEGPAGSGKTYNLLMTARQRLQTHPLLEGQRLLALSFMHGARRRLHEALVAAERDPAHRCWCATIDSFARRVAQRWRALINEQSYDGGPMDDRFAYTLKTAALACSFVNVRAWIGWSFPIIVIDEFQVCSSLHLEFLGAIEPATYLLAGVDAFQHLAEGEDNASVEFLQRRGTGTTLTRNRRTSQPGLLETANLARQGRPVARPSNEKQKGIYIQPTRRHYQAAVAAARNLSWYGGNHNVILSPIRRQKAPFFEKTVERLRTVPLTIRKGHPKVGPFKVYWADTNAALLEKELELAGLGRSQADDDLLTRTDLQQNLKHPCQRELARWFHRRERLTGETAAPIREAREALERRLTAPRSHAPGRTRGIEAMTIHQAKNREFDSVILLWPVQVGGGINLQRRLLYNAITRARQHACILIQDPQGDRLEQPRNQRLFGTLRR